MNIFFHQKIIKRYYPLWASLGCALFLIFGYFFLSVNVTASMPLGLYFKLNPSHIQAGDIVEICLPARYQIMGLSRHYLEAGHPCHGSVPLLKEVIAVPGDDVILNNDNIIVNGKKYFYATQEKDSLGRPLESCPRGAYLKTSGYWLLGTHAANSWDSRYWGAIDKGQILAKAKPLLTLP